mmetsp:Transcript_29394/g.51592  ORF Transcript_29394/g.51592 Transcript_29394/m.51592 type:complete len:172 (+) Transcript_29394:94-609(+)
MDCVSFGGSTRKYEVQYRSASARDNKKDHESDDEPLHFSDDEAESQPKKKKQKRDKERVRCSHILVKHTGSRRPSSWRQPSITISIEEAMSQISVFRKQIMESRDTMSRTFKKIAKEYSDCSSAKNGGDLGYFTRKKMQKAFEDASFALQVGELSSAVVSDSGVHIILRTG